MSANTFSFLSQIRGVGPSVIVDGPRHAGALQVAYTVYTPQHGALSEPARFQRGAKHTACHGSSYPLSRHTGVERGSCAGACQYEHASLPLPGDAPASSPAGRHPSWSQGSTTDMGVPTVGVRSEPATPMGGAVRLRPSRRHRLSLSVRGACSAVPAVERHPGPSQPVFSPLVGAAQGGDLSPHTTLAATPLLPNIVQEGGNEMANPLHVTRLADAQIDAELLLRRCEERVRLAVQSCEMTHDAGLEVLDLIVRAVEATMRSRRLAAKVYRKDRLADLMARNDLDNPSRRVREALADMNLAVINCPPVATLEPDDDRAA